MKLRQVMLALAASVLLAGIAYVQQATEAAGLKMVTAAEAFLNTLSPEQKAKATFAFDDPERTNWYFVPLQDKQRQPTRKGLRLEEMNAAQRQAALELIKAGTSPTGYIQATTIMSLEAILNELEQGKGPVRNPEWYFFSIFGTPSKTGKWGWRVEGHHLSLNFTIDQGKLIAATPFFFGANPATVKDGPRKGLRTLAEAEDLARALFKSLDEAQRKVALQPTQFPEIEQGKAVPNVGPPRGIAGRQLTDKQQALLRQLVESYAARMPSEIAAVELSRIKEAGWEQVHFAFAGGSEPGEPYTYRVQGPTFVIEFLNVQPDSAKNPANHIHSAWRCLRGDFGL
ncbi:MAG: DUF3500 domain-containing protein [Gemmataceae bacterium]|nr:DUF3500 domain-containing protein [Gemmataceae bacterium]MDW8265083.1 DUF3500 domain-containing protein [Gemmataceae bacterium]